MISSVGASPAPPSTTNKMTSAPEMAMLTCSLTLSFKESLNP